MGCADRTRTRWIAFLRGCGAAVLGSAASIASAQATTLPVPPPAPDWSFIAFETKSWGKTLTSWRLLANGGGSWTETVSADARTADRQNQVWHEIAPDVRNYITIERILRRLPAPAPDFNGCSNFLPDMPYGTIRLTRGATTTEIAWNSGCMDEAYAPLIAVLREADSSARGWGKEGKIIRAEPAP